MKSGRLNSERGKPRTFWLASAVGHGSWPAWFVAAQIFLCGAFASAADVDYQRDVKPVLKARCWSCHGAIRQEGGLRLDSVASMRQGGDSGTVLGDAGKPLSSLILQRVSAEDESERMPPEGDPLSAEQQSRLRAWLVDGAPAPPNDRPPADPKTHWAFQPIQSPSVPAGVHPVDHFVDRRLTAAGLSRASQADAVSLIRRMFLDLHGLAPTPGQISSWTDRLAKTHHGRSEAAAELIDLLLQSPRYGERWAQHWLDLVRYADTHGYEVNTPRPNAWPYRDYVIRAFNDDRPYNQFVLDQLAGDTTRQDAATGFMVAAAALLPGQIGADDASKRLARQDELDEIIIGTTATFLGMTVGCARCHDHKFDPIPQSDYYAMQAFFAGVKYGDRALAGDEFDARKRQADDMEAEIAALRSRLKEFQPKAFSGRTIVIDDEDLDRVTLLQTKNGHGENPAGTAQGYRDDPGSATRFGNLSRGRYTWWDNKPGQDVFTWNPCAAGRFRLWISWGVHGSGVHTRDARYVLDIDGNLATKDDQQEVARADQYYFAGKSEGDSERKPLWSGLQDAGVHELRRESRLILRGGDTQTGITADVIVLQEDTGVSATPLPQLRGPVSARKNIERFEPVLAKYVRFTSFETTNDNRYEPCIDELEVFTAGANTFNVALAKHGTRPTSSGNYSNSGKHQLKHINDGKYGNSFSWISNEKGKGWVQLEFSQPQRIDHIEWARDREGKFGDRLAIDYRIDISTDGETWAEVARDDDRVVVGTPHSDVNALLRSNAHADNGELKALAAELQAAEAKQKELRTPQMVFAGVFQKPAVTFVLNRGDPEQPVDEIAPRVLTAVGDLSLPGDATDQQRRTALAKWITGSDHPLTARVMVNRIWQYHFGVGLVETASDFGLNGALPSHPQLLDWLAADFMSHGWSVKHLHRRIMTSATYQQSAVSGISNAASSDDGEPQSFADPRRIDAGNRLLWRFPSRRLEAEAIRDCMLQVSGRLNLAMGGPGFDFFKSRGGLNGFPPVTEFTSDHYRRMIYAHKIRMEPVPVFGAFDCPDAGLPTPRRSQSTTALQALNLFNSPFVIDQAEAFAGRLQKLHPESLDRQITSAFQFTVGRAPTDAERAAVLPVVQTHDLSTLCRALFNSSEFLFIP